LLSTSNVNDGAWRHFYADFGYSNGDAGRLCVNGIQEASGTNSNSVNANTHIPARLGKSNDTFWGGFVGSLAEVAFWQVKLTDAEIAALAAGYRPIRVRPRNLQCYAPLIRETYELTNYGGSPVATGTSVSDHPRVIA
jgi:hypothetical protein